MEKQPEAALTRFSGGEERRLATTSRTGSLAHKEAALYQDEGGRSRGAGCAEWVWSERIAKLGVRDGSVIREPGRQPGSTILWEGSCAGVMSSRGVGAVLRG